MNTKTNHTNTQYLSSSANQVFIAATKMHCLPVKKLFTSRKMLIDNQMGEMQPVIPENKRLDSQRKPETFAISRFFPVPMDSDL